ncbi:amino acid ABC transporter permease [Allorhizobium taibaishanense]|uniref:Amino acid ABC transporter n=1 Tax=Allorhizobium taibaishanense TaxID=887144 RepID=A0A1Q9ABQ2_9HYPH|nr:amino acid ABC transporter permease [Allorhizobium taibaishanense]MBB4010612.1 polar amino acid transport system permease protein [Allorhizobium taibaishanense]OLP52286.1 amino acid ABC transporter [Allorhizobium taibaishanense]
MIFDPKVILDHLPEIASGALTTLWIWIVGMLLGAALGFLVATGRRYGGRLLDLPLGLAVEVLRGTPFLIQIFLVYYGGPYVGLSLDPIPCGLIGLTIYAAAYCSEIFRAGFAAVPHGHVEAAECLGLSRFQIVRRILLPEMALIVLPPFVNLAVILLKESAVLSIITVPELTATVSAIGSQQYAFLEAIFVLAVIYWVIVEAAAWTGRMAETRLNKLRFAAP